MRRYQNVVIFGNARWYDGLCGNSSQQLGLAFLQLGYRLLYITSNKSIPVSLPEYPGRFLNLSLSTRLMDGLRTALREWSATPEDTLFICSLASQASVDVLKFFSSGGFQIIYRVVDWFDRSEHNFVEFSHSLACKVSRLITVSHPDLVLNLARTDGKIITLSNGVDFDLFHTSLQDHEKPSDLIQGEITIGFWGTFWGNRMDWPVIRFLSMRNPEWQFNLIADVQYRDTDCRTLSPNVHFLGLKNKKELPPYLKYFDLCLIPYRTDFRFAKYANPIKALESLAALKPVVAPVNRSLEPYPGCFFYTSPEDAETQVRRAASAKLNDQEILDFARKNTWQKKVQTLLSEISNV
jgi:glycosyltransferase involved in cell wall biosynthesis